MGLSQKLCNLFSSFSSDSKFSYAIYVCKYKYIAPILCADVSTLNAKCSFFRISSLLVVLHCIK